MPGSNGLPLTIVASQRVGACLTCRGIPIVLCLRRFSTSPPSFARGVQQRKAVGKSVHLKPTKLSELQNDFKYLDVVIPPTKKGTPDMPPFWSNFRFFKSVIWNPRFQTWQAESFCYGTSAFSVAKERLGAPRTFAIQADERIFRTVLSVSREEDNDRGPNPKAIAKIKTICSQSYADNLIDTMEQLDPQKRMTWTWKQSMSDPKLISFMFHPILPGQPESVLIQAVVRVHGQEELDDGVSEPKLQESYTYIAIQLKMWVRPLNWLIVGRVSETSVEQIERDYDAAVQRIKDQKALARANTPPGVFKRTWNNVRAIFPESIANNLFGGARVTVRPQDLERKK